MRKGKKAVVAATVGTLALGGVLVGLGQTTDEPSPAFNEAPGISVNDIKKDDKKAEAKKDDKKEADNKAEVDVVGDEVENLRENRSDVIADYCRQSKLPAGEGKDNKGGTCVSYPLGEIAKNPVRVAFVNPPGVVGAGKEFELKVKIEDRFGPLDLNAFTNDASGKAGDTFLEHPGELDKDGRPLIHAHIGVTTLDDNGFPGENYDAAFSGLQGVKGDLSAKIAGLEPGKYRIDVYAGQPGHAPIPTALATQVQAFASVQVQVT